MLSTENRVMPVGKMKLRGSQVGGIGNQDMEISIHHDLLGVCWEQGAPWARRWRATIQKEGDGNVVCRVTNKEQL